MFLFILIFNAFFYPIEVIIVCFVKKKIKLSTLH